MKKILLWTIVAATTFLASCRKEYINPNPTDNTYEFVDEFVDNRNDWNFADNLADAYGVIANGTFSFNYLDPNGTASYIAKNIQFNPDRNFVIQTRIGSDNNMGLLFGYDAGSRAYGYSFTISSDGYYALWDEGGNGGSTDITEIVSPRTASFVNGNGNWNEVKIEQVGNTWIGYINGYKAFTVSARYIVKGSVGFVVVGNTRGEADYIQANYY
ncbi:hypothetical protein DBR32_11530 [Taibaiella sp. KBW10]|uniref:hypothetical protein n=1 Tax=Taibaiella sp. KBW10 TaxID=2153357 RepID=UPI000F594983|nr:hypothetical protein [Taibaiella sp. KBW10]RQO30204.1 hypothetical protein DBR32_11530 [Taibaiella sp. KBW10]